MITKVSTNDMSHDEWLERRRGSIGGSDAGIILGFNKYRSAYNLWAEKTGKFIPEDISDREAVRTGNDLEQYVAERFSEASGKKVQRSNAVIYNDQYPFAHANIDRKIVGENAGLECKTTSSWEILDQCKNNDFPDLWYCQMVHYMMVTGSEKWYLAVLILGRGFYWFTIERNDSEIEALAQAEKDFWRMVETEEEPTVDGTDSTSEAIQMIFPKGRSEKEIDLSAVSNDLTLIISLNKKIKELEKIRDEHKQAIMLFMQDAGVGMYSNITVMYKSQKTDRFCKEAYEEENGPIDRRFFKTTESRPFKIYIKKGEDR